MSRGARTALFVVAACGLGLLLLLSFDELPAFGHGHRLYRDLAVGAALSHSTSNVVSSVNFDIRALDTFGEETILLGSVTGVMALLRPTVGEREFQPPQSGSVLESTRLVGYLMMPVTLALGVDVVAHGHLTPGGGFQGGVVLATALLLSLAIQINKRLGTLDPDAARPLKG